eukprot:scaffold8696_cov90-Isochrysis_galbana.AAC.1
MAETHTSRRVPTRIRDGRRGLSLRRARAPARGTDAGRRAAATLWADRHHRLPSGRVPPQPDQLAGAVADRRGHPVPPAAR